MSVFQTTRYIKYLYSSISILQEPEYLKTSDEYKLGIFKLFLYGLLGKENDLVFIQKSGKPIGCRIFFFIWRLVIFIKYVLCICFRPFLTPDYFSLPRWPGDTPGGQYFGRRVAAQTVARKEPAGHLARCVQTGMGVPSALSTRRSVSTFSPPWYGAWKGEEADRQVADAVGFRQILAAFILVAFAQQVAVCCFRGIRRRIGSADQVSIILCNCLFEHCFIDF